MDGASASLLQFLTGPQAAASMSLADPPATSALGGAVGWVAQALLGTVAVSVAVIAVACIGLMMLTGRIDLRRGAAAILGAFILFGAAQIVAGVQSALAGGAGGADASATPIPLPPVTAPQRVGAGQPAQDDPYAGASVPRR